MTSALERTREPSRSEEGSVAPFVLLLSVCLAALLGLVADGGLALSAREAAVAEAEQAARAGAATLTPETLRAGGTFTGGPQAVEVAESVMALAGHAGSATVIGGVVTAVVTPFEVSTPLLALVGVASVSVTASASAQAVAG